MSSQYSGTQIRDLGKLVDAILEANGTVRPFLKDWDAIATLRTHLADTMYKNGLPVANYPVLVRAWFELGQLQETLIDHEEYSIYDKIRDEAVND